MSANENHEFPPIRTRVPGRVFLRDANMVQIKSRWWKWQWVGPNRDVPETVASIEQSSSAVQFCEAWEGIDNTMHGVVAFERPVTSACIFRANSQLEVEVLHKKDEYLFIRDIAVDAGFRIVPGPRCGAMPEPRVEPPSPEPTGRVVTIMARPQKRGRPPAGASVAAMCARLDEGASAMDVMREMPTVSANKLNYIDRYIMGREYIPGPDNRPNVKPHYTLIFGAPGCGKSRLAREMDGWMFKGADYCVCGSSLNWFDPFIAQNYVVFEEFAGSGSDITLSRWMQVTDRYFDCFVPVKYGFQRFVPKAFRVVMMHHPSTVFHYDSTEKYRDRWHLYNAWKRRVNLVIAFVPDGDGFREVRIPNPSHANLDANDMLMHRAEMQKAYDDWWDPVPHMMEKNSGF